MHLCRWYLPCFCHCRHHYDECSLAFGCGSVYKRTWAICTNKFFNRKANHVQGRVKSRRFISKPVLQCNAEISDVHKIYEENHESGRAATEGITRDRKGCFFFEKRTKRGREDDALA